MIEILVVLRAAWLWMVLASLTAAGATAGVGALTPPRWETSATLLVVPAETTGVVLARLNSRSLREALDMRPNEDLAAELERTLPVVTIRARAATASRAMALANAAADALDARLQAAEVSELQLRRERLSEAGEDLRTVVDRVAGVGRGAEETLARALVTSPYLLAALAAPPSARVVKIDAARGAGALPRIRWGLVAFFAGVGALIAFAVTNLRLWWRAMGAAAVALYEHPRPDDGAAAPSDRHGARAG